MKALITGINGFAGGHLARCLIERGHHVIGATRCADSINATLDDVELIQWNITDERSIDRLLQRTKPDEIYHLAAMTSESDIAADLEAAYRVNVIGTEYLLRAAKKHVPHATVLLAGSSAEYGTVPVAENPIGEDTPLRPVTMYGVTKVAQSMIGQRYWLSDKLRVIRTRAFNYTGPGQSDRFVIPSLCRKLAGLEQSPDHTLAVGNVDSFRDFTDVRDVVRAYADLATAGVAGEVYNIASGVTHQISALLDTLLGMVQKEVVIDRSTSKHSATDVPTQTGDAAKLKGATGWQPQIGIETTLRDTLDFWRNKTKSHITTS